MKALAEALRFLSIIPIPGKPPVETSRVLACYPWAGLIIGIITAVAAWAGSWILGAAGTAVLAVTIRIAVTGGLHMDGLADLADGFGGGRDREKRLAIMADSRLGSFGALALLVMFALQVTLIAELLSTRAPGQPISPVILYPLVLAPSISRGMIPMMIRLFPSARPGGMGDRNRASASTPAVLTSMLSALIIAFLFYGITGLITAAVTALCMLIIAAGVSRKLGGLTGDVYGTLIESGDLIVLFCLLAVYHFNLSTVGLMAMLT